MKTKINLVIVMLILFISCTSDDSNNSPNQISDLSSIQGDWYRVGGNNPDNNGMKVHVDNDQGIIEEPALSNFQVDDVKWADIIQSVNDDNTFTYQELGSTYNYFDATMELGVDNTLRISVANSGVGNIQKWVRTFIDPATELNDCSEYEGEGFPGNRIDNWEEYNEFDTYPSLLVTPGEPGGGYFTFSIGTELVPGLSITSSSGSSGTIFTGSSAGTTDPNNNQVAFLAHPGISYDVRVNPSNGTALFPLDYTMSWSYTPAEDCFEPNNTLQQAKFVPKDETHEAYGISGYVTNYVSSGDENTYDWYKVTTLTEGKIRFTLESCPSDLWVSCSLRQSSGAQINGQYTTIAGNTNINQPGSTYYYESNGEWPAGTYYVSLQMSGAHAVDLNTGSIPMFWSTPYEFKVEAIQ